MGELNNCLDCFLQTLPKLRGWHFYTAVHKYSAGKSRIKVEKYITTICTDSLVPVTRWVARLRLLEFFVVVCISFVEELLAKNAEIDSLKVQKGKPPDDVEEQEQKKEDGNVSICSSKVLRVGFCSGLRRVGQTQIFTEFQHL